MNPDAVFPEAFRYAQLPAFKYIIGAGALTGLCERIDFSFSTTEIFSSGIFASLLGSLLPLPRVLYAIAADGLIFRFISWIHPRLQTPIVATIIGGIASGRKISDLAVSPLCFDLISTYGTHIRYPEISGDDVNWYAPCLLTGFNICFILTVNRSGDD